MLKQVQHDILFSRQQISFGRRSGKTMRGSAVAGQVVFSSRTGQERKAMIKTQPSPDSYRDCLILQGKGKA
jgi:hypothetical protein